VEAAGIEPAFDFDAKADVPCDCENCQQCRAANALHLECLRSQCLALLDADLQSVILAWDGLNDTARRAINTYVQSQMC
jgi:hypothetical protein